MNGWIIVGAECPECGQSYKSRVTARLLNEAREDIGQVIYCLKCEHVWEDILWSGRGHMVAYKVVL